MITINFIPRYRISAFISYREGYAEVIGDLKSKDNSQVILRAQNLMVIRKKTFFYLISLFHLL